MLANTPLKLVVWLESLKNSLDWIVKSQTQTSPNIALVTGIFHEIWNMEFNFSSTFSRALDESVYSWVLTHGLKHGNITNSRLWTPNFRFKTANLRRSVWEWTNSPRQHGWASRLYLNIIASFCCLLEVIVKVAHNFCFGRSHLGFVRPPPEKPMKCIQYPGDPSKTQKIPHRVLWWEHFWSHLAWMQQWPTHP